MELYLHIGSPKTGTSAIQYYMYKNRKILKEKFGILYPHDVEVHHSHALCLMDDPYTTAKLNKNVVLPDPMSLYYSTIKEAEKAKVNKAVISTEWFWELRSREVKRLSDVLGRFSQIDKIFIITYLRRQDILLESSYKQGIKHYDWKIFGNLFAYAPTDYLSILESWKRTFPDAEIIVRIYERSKLKNGDVIDDFLSIFGIDRKDVSEEKVEVNPSLSHLSALALKRINEEFDLPSNIHQKVVDFLLEIDKKEGSFLKTFMTLEERIKLLEFYRESNERLFREYFGTENQFVLSEEEIEFYKEQDKIPREKIKEAVEDRYRRTLKFLYNIMSDPPKRNKIYLHEKYGGINPLVKYGLVNSGVFGRVDVVDNEKIAGWILDLDTKKPAEFVINVNGMAIYEGRTNFTRKDIAEITGYEIPSGFVVTWRDIEIPPQIRDSTKFEVEVVHKRTGYIVPGNYREVTRRALPECRVKYFPDNFEFFAIDIVNANLLNGRLILSGLLLPKNAEGVKLTVKDAEGIKEIQWGLPSPIFGELHPDNPIAKNARFRVDNVVPDLEKPIEVFLNGEKVAEIIIDGSRG
jgi:hypothetical protein